jgi:hypothetical protein
LSKRLFPETVNGTSLKQSGQGRRNDMDFSIYVYGGGEILAAIFNGIAMLFKSGSPYYTSAAKLSMAIGVLYVAAQAIPKASLPIFFKSWFMPTFLLTALFYGPKTEVHIIDRANMDRQYQKIDHIPFGIAAIASLSSQIGEYLTENVETLFTVNDDEKFSKVGPMFGSKLIQAANQLTIKDPLMRENLKDFTRQCFAWPYVFSNLAPGKKAAMESQDMLEFITTNAHPMLGIYWRDPNGQTTFMNCVTCAVKVKQVIGLEVDQGLTSLAQKLFGAHVDPTKATARLNQYFGNAWGRLSKGSSESAKIVQQELMLNSYREAIQDKRDQLRLGRSATEMAHLNAARGIAQQDSSFLVKAVMAGTLVPIFHTIVFALALIYFSIMAPMTFLPRGTVLLVQWVKVMMYLATWPVLFAILNCIGQMFAAKAMATKVIGYGDGLTMLTQSGMGDIAESAYLAVIGLQLSVPFLAWTLLWGGGHAFSQLSTALTQSPDSFAGKAGAETVDGNVSFDVQSLHNSSVANGQYAQQQMAPNFNYGSRIDDGKMTTLYGPGGQVTMQEHQTNLGTNVSQNDAFSTMLGMQSMMMQNSGFQQTQMAQTQFQKGISDLVSVGNTFADNKNWTDTFGNSESSQAQKSLSNSMDTATKFAKDNNISLGKAMTILTEAGVNAGVGVGSGSLASLSLAAGAKANWNTDASDKELLSKAKSNGMGESFAKNFNHGIQYLQDHKGSVGNSSQLQKLDQAQSSFNQSKSSSDQASATLGMSKQLSQQASEQRQQTLSSSSNINPQVLQYVADKKFGGDQVAAAHWQSQNPQGYHQETTDFLKERKQGIKQGGMFTPQDINQHHQESQNKIEKVTPRGEEIQKRIDGQSKQLNQQENSFNNKIFNKAIEAQKGIKKYDGTINQGKKNIQQSLKQKEEEHTAGKEETLTVKAGKKWIGINEK